MTEQTIRVVIDSTRRLGSTVNGNPIWVLTDTDGNTYRTANDVMCAYKVCDNWHDKPVVLTIETKRVHTYVVGIDEND